MEAFSLLKYWKGGGGGSVCTVGGGGCSGENSAGIRSTNASKHSTTTTTTTTTILDTANHADAVDTDEEEDDDEGPFFDLEFALPEGEEDEDDDDTLERESEAQNHGSSCAEVVAVEEVVTEGENETVQCSNGGGERKFKFTLSSSSSASAASNNSTTTSSGSYNDCVDPNLPLSPSDDLFFKGRLVPIEASEVLINATDGVMNTKAHQFQVASLLKPATKFRVFMSDRLKKSKLQTAEQPPKQNQENLQQNQTEKQSESTSNSKFMTVKCKVEEVPIVSLFTRDSSSRGGGGGGGGGASSKPQTQKETPEESAAEKRNSKDVVQKYLKKVKPLYIRVSKRVVEKKLKFSSQLTLNLVSSPDSGGKQTQQPPDSKPVLKKETNALSSVKSQKSEEGVKVVVEEDGNVNDESKGLSSSCTGVGVKNGGSNLASGFKVMCKHLGKSKSASSAVVHSVAPTAATAAGDRRRDDSLLQQQDGIQSAILHCKRSFNASRDSEATTVLSRSTSDPPYHDKSSEEGNNTTTVEG